MFGIEALWRPLEGLATEFEDSGEPFGLGCLLPGVLLGIDVLADLIGDLGLWPPQPRADKAPARFKVNIEARCVGIFGLLVAKVDAGVDLVRRLVFGEAGVALNAEQRAAYGAAIGQEVRAERVEGRAEVGDEVERIPSET